MMKNLRCQDDKFFQFYLPPLHILLWHWRWDHAEYHWQTAADILDKVCKKHNLLHSWFYVFLVVTHFYSGTCFSGEIYKAIQVKNIEKTALNEKIISAVWSGQRKKESDKPRMLKMGSIWNTIIHIILASSRSLCAIKRALSHHCRFAIRTNKINGPSKAS